MRRLPACQVLTATALVAAIALTGGPSASASMTARGATSPHPHALTIPGSFWTHPDKVDPSMGVVTGVSCATPSFCVSVDGNGYVTEYSGTGWSAPALVDPGGALVAVSCPAVDNCVAVDSAGNAVSFDGTWSAPVSIDPFNGGLVDVSCATTTHCVALDVTGQTLTEDDGVWGTAGALPGLDTTSANFNSPALSCATATFCMVVADDSYWMLQGTTWSSGVMNPGAYNLDFNSVSCTSPTFCLAAASYGGQDEEFSGTVWSSIATSWAGSVTCTSPTFCMASDSDLAETWNGALWSNARIPSLQSAGYEGYYDQSAASSCTSPTFCAVVGASGMATIYNGASWTTALPADPYNTLTSVSCASVSSCVAVDAAGNVLAYNGTTWSAPARIDPNGGGLQAVSCATTSFCMAVDADGGALEDVGGAWGGVTIATSNSYGLTSISCPTTTFCAAVGIGTLDTWTQGTWSDSTLTGYFNSVSCASTTSCVAVGVADASFNGVTWSYLPGAPQFEGSTVSCESAGTCTVSTVVGQVYDLTGDTWTLAASSLQGGPLQSLSCPSTSFCGSIAYNGSAQTSAGPYWLPPIDLHAGSGESVSCPAVGTCMAVTSAGDAVLGTGGAPVATVTIAPRRVLFGQQFKVRIQVFPAGQSGEVTVSSVAEPWLQYCTVEFTDGAASCTSRLVTAGSNDLEATYHGTSSSALSVAVVTARVQVRRVPTTLTLAGTPRVVVHGTQVTLLASGLPYKAPGLVWFYVGTRLACDDWATSWPVECLTRLLTKPGLYAVWARYSGSAKYGGSQTLRLVRAT